MSNSVRGGAWVAIAVGMLASVPVACGSWMWPDSAPVGRLAANVGKYIQEHPDDPQGYYLLARIHSLAFWLKSRELSYYPGDNPLLPGIDHRFQSRGPEAPPEPGGRVERPLMAEEELGTHLTESLRNFGKALELEPDSAKAHLGLAYVLEYGASFSSRIALTPPMVTTTQPTTRPRDQQLRAALLKVAEWTDGSMLRALERTLDPQVETGTLTVERTDARRAHRAQIATWVLELRNDSEKRVRDAVWTFLDAWWVDCAICEYARAHDLSFASESAEAFKGAFFGMGDLVSFEAGEACVRLIEARRTGDPEFADTKKRVEVNLQTTRDTVRGGSTTPLILDLGCAATLDELLDSDAAVAFDLDGDTCVELWPWVRPTTGFLVWDPEASGCVSSGRQLFGSVTWWMFFRDGYHALDSLDDDRDGWVAGRELAGLAVWFDRDSDGVSDAGEVVPVERLGIAALAAFATGKVGESLESSCGLILADGRVRPTYDWVTTPVAGSGRH